MRMTLPIVMVLLWTAMNGCAARQALPDFSSSAKSEKTVLTATQQEILQTARSLIGTPYRFGGTTPKGFDCSGFIGYVYQKAARRALPRTTEELARTGRVRPPRSPLESPESPDRAAGR